MKLCSSGGKGGKKREKEETKILAPRAMQIIFLHNENQEIRKCFGIVSLYLDAGNRHVVVVLRVAIGLD